MRDGYGLDGAMIGRASIGNPWFFNQVKEYFKTGRHAKKTINFRKNKSCQKTFRNVYKMERRKARDIRNKKTLL